MPGIRASRALHHADANKDGFINKGEMDELVKYTVRVGFSVLFMGPTVLFQLTFIFTYNTFGNKFSVLAK